MQFWKICVFQARLLAKGFMSNWMDPEQLKRKYRITMVLIMVSTCVCFHLANLNMSVNFSEWKFCNEMFTYIGLFLSFLDKSQQTNVEHKVFWEFFIFLSFVIFSLPIWQKLLLVRRWGCTCMVSERGYL